jgi:hypothetical protein
LLNEGCFGRLDRVRKGRTGHNLGDDGSQEARLK